MTRHLDALRTDGDALLAAAERDLGAPVATCPGWSVADLVTHVAEIHRYVARQVRIPERIDKALLEPADPEQLLIEAAAALDELLVALTETGPQAPAWNWDRDAENVAGFWHRRMAHETSVHRWDAQAAVGTPAGFDTWLACDGVDEALTGFLPRRRGRAKEELTGTVHLHATEPVPDAPAEWTVEFGAEGATTLRYGHAKGDAALRGPAGELLLAVWGRPATLDRFGDEELLAAVRAE